MHRPKIVTLKHVVNYRSHITDCYLHIAERKQFCLVNQIVAIRLHALCSISSAGNNYIENHMPNGKLNDCHTLYIRSMGKALQVTAMFSDAEKANAYMETHRDEGAVAEFDGIIYLANLYDKGVNISK